MTMGQDEPSSTFDEDFEDDRRDGDSVESMIDLDVLRGWSESRNPELRRHHRLPALAELVELDADDAPQSRYPIHGPDLLLGRFQSQYAPIDLFFDALKDHQTYRLGAPHAHLSFDDHQWKLQVLSPRSTTRVDGSPLEHLHNPEPLDDGTELVLGITRFRFHTTDVTLPAWEQQRQRLLETVQEPALFLKRRGGPCGPLVTLDDQTPLVVGRSFPAPGHLPNTDHWPGPDDNFWDLSGLRDCERKHIAFRHARIALHKGRWTIEPLSSRQRTFVNRIAISGKIALETGDEIGLGSVLLRFHHPHRTVESSRPRHVPSVIDWSEGRRPSPPQED